MKTQITILIIALCASWLLFVWILWKAYEAFFGEDEDETKKRN